MGERRLTALFKKTFYEQITWLAVFHSFGRLVTLNAIFLHAMAVIAFTDVLCEAEGKAAVPAIGAEEARDAVYNTCLERMRGGGVAWKALSTITVTHAFLQTLFFALGFWIIPSYSTTDAPSATSRPRSSKVERTLYASTVSGAEPRARDRTSAPVASRAP